MSVRRAVGRPLQRLAERAGYEIRRRSPEPTYPFDFDADDIGLYEAVRPFTLTGPERVLALRDAVRYIVAAGVPGALVECGVWKGGSMLVAIRTLLDLGVRDRDLYLYDTYTHMPPPGPEDMYAWGQWSGDDYETFLANPFYANDPVERVQALLESTGYPAERLHFVAGMVEDTIPGTVPEVIALCRLDTDLYVSTAHEMAHLCPRLAEGAVLIIDDYGHFMGAKKAVDEYFDAQGVPALLHRIDNTGRTVVVSRAMREALTPPA
jgi:O-methyltransferase